MKTEREIEKVQHTPGPWTKDGTYSSHYPVIRDRQGVAVAKTDCSICPGDWEQNIERARANARLIAAAPELLEACEEVLPALEEFQTNDINALTVERVAELMDKLSAAIAKAKGEQP